LAQFPYLLTVITLVDFRVMNTEQRLTDLETALAEYIRYNTQAQQRFEAESKQFREEMLAFKETLERDTQAFKAAIERDTQAFKEEIRRDTQAFKEEIRRDTKALKAEMRTFKEEIRRDTEAFKAAMQALTERLENELKESKRQLENELRESKRQWNKQWGELSNKLGTIVEDIIFPASRPVIESVFRVKVQQLATRVFRQQGNLRAEFDVVAVSERQVFLIEVKSTPRFDYLTDFVDNRIPVFRQLFPEYASLDLVPIFASLSIPDDIVKAATNRRVFAMAYREWEYMDILNAKELLPNF
jgi:polyhydroxyalkanoate synthesis regulator protein